MRATAVTLYLCLLSGAAACTTTTSHSALTVSGQVTDEATGLAVPNASLTFTGVAGARSADANGEFQLQLPQLRRVLAQAVAPGYIARSYVLTLPSEAASFRVFARLRRVGQVTQVALPQDTNAPIQVSQANADGGVVLTISPNALVRPDGTVAVGNANVALTYWHPLQSVHSAPGDLLTTAADGSIAKLRTFGMADIEVSQGNALLQIAPGQRLPLAFTVPATLQPWASTPATAPDLYYLNRATGLWERSGSFDDGTLSLDANAGVVTAMLPHLSDWNLDGLQTDIGGCVTGNVTNKCGAPLKNFPVTLYFMELEELADFHMESDATGKYCVNTGTHATFTVHGGDHTTAYLSASNDVSNSSQCNPTPGVPIPAPCLECVNQTNACCVYPQDYGVPDDRPCPVRGRYGVTQDECHDYCAALPVLTISPCHVCPGTLPAAGDCYGNSPKVADKFDTSCTQMPDVAIDDGDPNCKNNVAAPTTDTPPACNTPVEEGTPCRATVDCCSNTLICSDYVCVPPTDPGSKSLSPARLLAD